MVTVIDGRADKDLVFDDICLGDFFEATVDEEDILFVKIGMYTAIHFGERIGVQQFDITDKVRPANVEIKIV